MKHQVAKQFDGRAARARKALWRGTCLMLLTFLIPFFSHGQESTVDKGTDVPFTPRQLEFFEKRVRPLLAEHCYACHSRDSEKGPAGGLLLDSSAGWLKGGDSGPAVVPGEADESLLIQAVRYDGYEMPPTGRLPQAAVDTFTKWVNMGAPAPDDGATSVAVVAEIDWEEGRKFWAFVPPRDKTLAGLPSDHVRDPIDWHVEVARREQSLVGATESSRRLWLRRVTYDLTGLPPTADEWRNFSEDRHPLAYERVVDRLLNSPAFGEQWGRHWLDVARYADSNGSDFNATFYNAWRYRNYVIDSFNSDRPFDEFIVQQIAGDLLPAASDAERYDQLVATTFLLIGPKMLSERDKPRLLLDVADEQIDTVGRVFQGLTLGCARCHDHKFDPISTEDYYAMLGIFHSTESLYGESQQYVSTWRETELPTSETRRAVVEQHTRDVKQLEEQIKAVAQAIESYGRDGELAAELARGILLDDDAAEQVGSWKVSQYSKDRVGKQYLHDDQQGKGEKSIRFRTRLPADGVYEVRLSYCSGPNRTDGAPVTVHHAEGQSTVSLNQQKPPAIVGLLQPIGQYSFSQDRDAMVEIATAGTDGYVIVDAVQFVPVGQPSDSEAPRDEEKSEKNLEALKELEQQKAELEKRLAELKKQAPAPLPTAMAAREAEEVGDQAIRIRGMAARRGRLVARGYLRVLGDGLLSQRGRPEVVERRQSGRLELARWIASRDNPLTARVIVNRVWSKLMGEGLVRSVDNFGRLGQRPTHPELLDQLAVDFVEQGWRFKPLVRRIVLSSTYRQSSKYSASNAAIDPENRWLWRQNRKPLSAEQYRDSLLSIAGRLQRSTGESPVAGLGRLAIDNSKQGGSGAEKRNALRSIYTPIVRNDLHPFLVAFDAADPDVVMGRRPRTNVPAQALMLLNDPLVRESAERLAELTWREGAVDEANQQLFHRALGRPPTLEERTRLRTFAETLDGSVSQALWVDWVHSLLASTEYRWLD